MPVKYISGMPPEYWPTPWTRGALYATELAELLHRDVDEVCRVLGVRRTAPISKTWLWTLIAAGADRSTKRLAEIEQRIDRIRRLHHKPITRTVKRAIVERDQYLCRYCGRRVKEGMFHFDHVIPRCLEGQDHVGNVVVACQPCNKRKGRRLPHEAGMRLLPPGTRLQSHTRKRYPPLPVPDVPYETLVMGLSSEDLSPQY